VNVLEHIIIECGEPYKKNGKWFIDAVEDCWGCKKNKTFEFNTKEETKSIYVGRVELA